MKKYQKEPASELVKIIIEIRYPETPVGLDYRKKLFQIVTEEAPKKFPPFKEGMVVDIKKKKMRIALESNRTAVDLEDVKDVEVALENVLGLFKRLDKIIEWGKITRLGIRTIWASGTNKPLQKLVTKFKKRFYIKNSILDKADDVAVFFTLRDGENRINYASGPIEKEELRIRYAVFSKMSLPKRAILADIDYYTTKPFDFDLEYLTSFTGDALEYAKGVYKETLKVLG